MVGRGGRAAKRRPPHHGLCLRPRRRYAVGAFNLEAVVVWCLWFRRCVGGHWTKANHMEKTRTVPHVRAPGWPQHGSGGACSPPPRPSLESPTETVFTCARRRNTSDAMTQRLRVMMVWAGLPRAGETLWPGAGGSANDGLSTRFGEVVVSSAQAPSVVNTAKPVTSMCIAKRVVFEFQVVSRALLE